MLSENGDGVDDQISMDSISVDMDSADEPDSRQNKHESLSRKFPSTSSSTVLQKAIDSLKHKFPDFNPPQSEPDWQKLYEDTLCKAKKHELSYEDHLWSWLNLIITAKDLKKSEYDQNVLNCYENAVITLPIKIFEEDTTWVALVNGFYSQILAGDFEHSPAKSVLEPGETPAKLVLRAMERKFKYSPKHARAYWNAVMKNEKQLMKTVGLSLQDQIVHSAEHYKKRFSNPYLHVEEDYEDFVRWSTDVSLPRDLRMEVQNAFLQNSTSEKMSLLTSMFERANVQSAVARGHSLLFEDWIEILYHEEHTEWDKVVAPCEEMIVEVPDSFFYYSVFLNTLASPMFEGVKTREEKICDVVRRGFRHGKKSCEAMEHWFLEQSLVIASKTLSVARVLDLIEDSLAQFPVTADVEKWYESSRGIIVAISNLAHGGKLESVQSSFDSYFERVIAPCTMELYRSSVVPEELAEDKTRYETKYFELLKLWVATQESYFQLDWPKLLYMWTNIFMDNKSPVMLVGYVDFVKNRGTSEEAITASNFALHQMYAYENNEDQSKRSTRRCYIKLLQGHLELVSATGNIDLQVSISQQLQRRLNSYITSYGNEFRDIINSGSQLNGFHPSKVPSILDSRRRFSSEALCAEFKKLNQEPFIKSSSSNSLATKLKTSDTSEREHDDTGTVSKGFRVFISNLSYQANEKDIVNAFKDKGFYPLKVEIKRTAQGKSIGHGFAEFDTKDTAELAIKLCDKFNVRGRATFVSQFKTGQRFSTKKPPPNQPTTLNLTNLPPEWKDEDKITNKLSCYGHVKSVTIEEQEDASFSVKVQFHMTDDAQNAYVQIMEKKVFEDTNVSCRMGYAPKKQLMEDKKDDGKKIIKKRQVEEKKSGGSKKKVAMQEPKKSKEQIEVVEENNMESSQMGINNVKESNQPIGPQMPPSVGLAKEKPKLRPARGFNPVPTQVRLQDPRIAKRTHMKARLDIGVPSASSASSPSSSLESKVRKIAIEEEKIQSDGRESPASVEVTTMEEEGRPSSLSNKDFQSLFKKN